MAAKKEDGSLSKFLAWKIFENLSGPAIIAFALLSNMPDLERVMLAAIGVLVFLILNPEIFGLD